MHNQLESGELLLMRVYERRQKYQGAMIPPSTVAFVFFVLCVVLSLVAVSFFVFSCS